MESRDSPSPPSKWAAWLGPFIALCGFLSVLASSAVTGPTFTEEARVHAVVHAMALARAFGHSGLSVTVSSAARGIYAELAPFGVWAGLLSGWVAELSRMFHLLDMLTASRSGWLLIAGAAPGALYYLVERSRGTRVAALAAVVLVSTPRWLHGAAVASEPVVVASLWLVLTALYVRSYPLPVAERRQGPRSRSRLFGVLFAIALGAALAESLATLLVLPLLIVHSALSAGPAGKRDLGRARATVPFGLLFCLVLVPLVVALMSPQLWRGGGMAVVEWLLSPLAPTIEPGAYRGVTDADHVPPGYAADFLAATTPVVTLSLAIAGATLLLIAHVKRRRSGERGDSSGLGLLSLAFVIAVLVGPALAPRALTRFPPRAEAALPFIAALAAIGLDATATRLVRESRRTLALLGVAILYLATCMVGLSTAGASFGLLAGGTSGAMATTRWAVGDGSELSVLAPAIDRLGRSPLTIEATEVPRGYFVLLRGLGRLAATVEVGKAGQVAIVRGRHRSTALAEAKHRGTTVWSLVPR